ncbi:histidinol-phosphatase HisJ [Exiguobacterium sp.]|uniref:histidinol-phosphatase HisJ n=1 Tax=Exiguobacterium sp. TaxID=44751 RepID=UPI00263BB6D6|nr:histidinol-phosphatase HisJ [Exiguobacterium sp.]MCC5891641.1 histidinol-phosphatase HisJ [Exiguobacterium sp.]
MIDFTHDGHIHTPFCPHGTTDALEAYIETARARGMKTLTFTEHAPLPRGFTDPVPDQDSAMPLDVLPRYLDAIQQLKQAYAGEIDVRVGLEIDYVPGFAEETIAQLEPYAASLDETILSQHFLLIEGDYFPVDFSLETFDVLVDRLGSFEAVIGRYYESLITGLAFEWERLNVKRIGHLDLPIKYEKQYVWERKHVKDVETRLLRAIHDRGFGLDLNTAGLRKPDCGAIYAEAVAAEATALGIPLVLGSDAHSANDVASDFMRIRKKATFR